MHTKGNEVTGSVVVEEDLRAWPGLLEHHTYPRGGKKGKQTYGISNGPGDKSHCNDGRLLRCTGDVTRDHRESQCLGRPERQRNVVAQKKACLSCCILVHDGHQDNSPDERPVWFSNDRCIDRERETHGAINPNITMRFSPVFLTSQADPNNTPII